MRVLQNLLHKLRIEISELKSIHIFKLKHKLDFLCNSNNWKHIGRNNLIQNISNTQLNTVHFEALQFIPKFATKVNNHNILDFINYTL